MKRIVLAAATLLVAVAAEAQIYQWQDENNKTVISDRPPAGKVKGAREVAGESPPAAAEGGGRSLADREMAFRQRQKEAQESAEEAEREQRLAAQKQENCQNARRALQVLESGERVAMRDSRGERYYLDDQQREQEIGKLRRDVQANCP